MLSIPRTDIDTGPLSGRGEQREEAAENPIFAVLTCVVRGVGDEALACSCGFRGAAADDGVWGFGCHYIENKKKLVLLRGRWW